MNETADLLERVGDRFAFPDQAFERLERRRDRRRRNRRIASGAAGIAVFAALVFALARATWSDSAPRPGEPQPSPTPSVGIERSVNPILRANEVVVSETGVMLAVEAVDLETHDRRTLVACKDPCVFFSAAAASVDDGWLAYKVETCLGALPCEADAGLWVANDQGEHRQLIRSCEPDRCFPLVWAWSPTSATLAIAGPADAPSGPRSLLLVDPETGGRTEVADPAIDVETLAWSPDGSRIAYAGAGSVYVVPLDGGAPTLLSEGSAPRWSPDGSRLALTVQDGISVVTVDGSRTIRIANGYEAAWSPDGNRIVTHVEKRTSGSFHEELWVAEVEGSGVAINILPPECCSNGIVDETLTWSPDGTRIAFLDGAEEHWHVVNADGTGDLGLIDELRVAAWRAG
jgi:dipeptidyl aminopeptidase/acylaminoacyl peptidase